MEKKYFVVSVGQPGKDYDDENLQRCLDNSCFVLNEYNKQKGVIQQIAVGDVLILKYKDQLIGYGKAVSPLQTDKDLSKDEDWSWRIDIRKWIMGNPTSKYGISWETEAGAQFSTVKEISETFALQKIREIAEP